MKIGFYLNISEYNFCQKQGIFIGYSCVSVKGNDNYMGQKVSFDFGFFGGEWNIKITVTPFPHLC